jgi:hypothetical protein
VTEALQLRFDVDCGVEHRGWERLGARGPDRRQANERGWGGLLPHYLSAL